MPDQSYDIAVKNIFADITDDMMAYFIGVELNNAEELNIEFTHVERRSGDMVYRCALEGNDVVVHLEFQSDNDKKMPYRMLRYALEIIEKYGLPIYQAVIYMGKDRINMDSGITYKLGEENKLDYKYRLIDIGATKFEDVIKTEYYDLYALLPLMDRDSRRRRKDEYLRMCTDAIVAAPMEINRKKEIAFKAEIFSGLVFTKDVIERVFKEVNKMLNLQESETYKIILDEGIEKGIEKGAAQTLIKQLRKKLNGLPPEYEKRISEASKEQLDAIAEDIFDIDDLSKLDKYLS